jgi:hypothetical protein
MEERYTLYTVDKNSIEPLGIVCDGWMELRRVYFERAADRNEVLLAVHNGNVTRIETRGGIVLNGQGQRTLTTLSGHDLQQEVVAPAATAALHGLAHLRRMLFEERQREPVQPREVLAEVLVTNA